MLLFTVLALAISAAGEPGRDLSSLPARPAPDWVTHGVMYQIQPRAFTPEGTLRAATARLARVAELGVDVVYLCPVFVAADDPDRASWSPRQRASRMNNPRNPYRIKDYYHVDPEYGTDDDLRSFVAEAHRLGMRVLLDMVYLHCGPNAVFLEEHPDFVQRDEDGNVIAAAWGFPAVNHADPQLREYLWQNMEYWCREFEVDGFRCDVSDGVPPAFWETARKRLEKIRPDLCLLAEGRRREDQLRAFDLSYSFGWFNALRRVVSKGEPAASLRETWETMAAERPRGARFIRYIDNHDVANDAYHNRIERAWGARCVRAALVLNFTLDGVPLVYNGQEVADTARHSIFGRSPIDWAGGDTPAGKARFAFCKRLCAMRRAEPALAGGEVVWLDNDRPDAVASFLRRTPDDAILSVVNLSEGAVEVRVALPEPAPRLDDVLISDGAEAAHGDGRLALTLEGFGYRVAKDPPRPRTHFSFTKVGKLIGRPADMPKPGPYYPTLVSMDQVDRFPYPYALYFSTDHDRGQGGIWLYVCRGEPTEADAWKSYDRAVADGDFDYLPEKPAGNPLFVDRVQGRQTETPHAHVVDGTVYMTYHNAGAGHSQSTLLATSPDGVNFTRIRGQRDSVILDYDPAHEVGNGHTGYFRWRPNPFPGVDWRYVGYSLHGGGDDFHGALWGSEDAVDWEKLQVFDSLEGHAVDANRIVRRRAVDPGSITDVGDGEFVAICSIGHRSSGGRARVLELYEIYLAADGKTLTRRARKILGNGPPGAYDEEELSAATSVVIGDTWHLLYVGARDRARENTIMGAVGKFDPNAPKAPRLPPNERTRDLRPGPSAELPGAPSSRGAADD